MSEAKIEAEPIEAEATIPTNPMLFAGAKAELPTPVEYLAAMIQGGHELERVQAAVRAAAPNVVINDTPGLVPTPILGPVYNNFVGNRPIFLKRSWASIRASWRHWQDGSASAPIPISADTSQTFIILARFSQSTLVAVPVRKDSIEVSSSKRNLFKISLSVIKAPAIACSMGLNSG